MLVEGERADVTQPAWLFALPNAAARVQIMLPGDDVLDMSEMTLDEEPPPAESPTRPDSLPVVTRQSTDDLGDEPVFRTYNSAALARARASRKNRGISSAALLGGGGSGYGSLE